MKIFSIGLVAALAACQSDRNMDVPAATADAATPTTAISVDSASAVPQRGDARSTGNNSTKVSVLFFGTSLTAGYGLDPSEAFPNLIEQRAQAAGVPIQATNAGLSGETSAGALRRITWTLQRPVDIIVLETGGNDALRALNADSLEANLSAIVTQIRIAQPKARILLAVMEAPPNLGGAYTARFRRAYSEVARREGLTLVPFLLDGVAGSAELNQPDGVHPNSRGERIVADNVWRVLKPVVGEVYASRRRG